MWPFNQVARKVAISKRNTDGQPVIELTMENCSTEDAMKMMKIVKNHHLKEFKK